MSVLDDFSSGRRANLEGLTSPEWLAVFEGDVRDPEALHRALDGVWEVLHLAARCVQLSLTDPRSLHEGNAGGMLEHFRALLPGAGDVARATAAVADTNF